jgi:bifunctional non-homologous end joining protein LigD
LLSRVAARNRRTPLSFVAFDVLAFDAEPVIDRPYSSRRVLLDSLALNADTWCTVPRLHRHVVDVLTACRDHDIEGIVAKRVDSPYRPGGRSRDWLKLKTVEWRATHADRRHDR